MPCSSVPRLCLARPTVADRVSDELSVVCRWQGFHFSRPPVGTPGEGVRLRPDRRTPFIPMDPQQRPEAWNYGCVLTTGGPAIVGDEMCKCSLCQLSVVSRQEA